MKFEKKKLLIFITCLLLLILNTTNVFAIMPKSEYNPISMAVSKIMKLAVFAVLIAYGIFLIIYLIKSKKEMNKKIRKLIKWLIITMVIMGVLWFGADVVKEIGMTSTSIPNLNLK